MGIDNFFDNYGRLVDQWTGRAKKKSLADYSDAQIAEEYHRRALKQLGDQRQGVGRFVAPNPSPSDTYRVI